LFAVERGICLLEHFRRKRDDIVAKLNTFKGPKTIHTFVEEPFELVASRMVRARTICVL